MAKVQSIVRLELDPHQPVPEICNTIIALLPYNPGHEEAILRGVQAEIEARLKQMEKPKEGEKKDDKPVLQPKRK